MIVTADDFGLATSVNRAVEHGHVAGVLSTASLMVAADAAADAVDRARRFPTLRVGLHLVLVEGATVLPRRLVPDLLDEEGLLPSSQVKIGFRYFLHPAIRKQLAAEIRAQFEAFRATRLPLDHANAHKHMHLHPTVGQLIIAIGGEYGLRAIRVPAEPSALLAASGAVDTMANKALLAWTHVLRRQARRAGLTTNDHTFGIASSGHMTAAHVARALQRLPSGLTELYLHPAIGREPLLQRLMPSYDHDAEAACLVDPQIPVILREQAIALTTWMNESCR